MLLPPPDGLEGSVYDVRSGATLDVSGGGTLLATEFLPRIQAWKQVVFLGVCGIAGYNTLAYIALQSTTATNAALINSFVPVVTSVRRGWLRR